MNDLGNMKREELIEHFKKQIPKRLKVWYIITGRKRKIDEKAENMLINYFKFIAMMSRGWE